MLACESDMLDPVVGFNDNYGHANKAALWAALSRLYLNADTYVGVNKYTECATYSKKIYFSRLPIGTGLWRYVQS